MGTVLHAGAAVGAGGEGEVVHRTIIHGTDGHAGSALTALAGVSFYLQGVLEAKKRSQGPDGTNVFAITPLRQSYLHEEDQSND